MPLNACYRRQSSHCHHPHGTPVARNSCFLTSILAFMYLHTRGMVTAMRCGVQEAEEASGHEVARCYACTLRFRDIKAVVCGVCRSSGMGATRRATPSCCCTWPRCATNARAQSTHSRPQTPSSHRQVSFVLVSTIVSTPPSATCTALYRMLGPLQGAARALGTCRKSWNAALASGLS